LTSNQINFKVKKERQELFYNKYYFKE